MTVKVLEKELKLNSPPELTDAEREQADVDLKEAAKHLRVVGWFQGNYTAKFKAGGGYDFDSPCCSLGAIMKVTKARGEDDVASERVPVEETPAARVLEERIEARYVKDSVAHWNDAEGRVVEEVLDLMEGK